MTSPGLRVTLRRTSPPAGQVLVVNAGRGLLRLWRTGCRWGDEALSFTLNLPDGAVVEIRRASGEYTANPPAAVEVAPGQAHAIAFDLGDGSWTPPPPRTPSALAARYAILVSDEALALGVWTGAVAGVPTSLAEDR